MKYFTILLLQISIVHMMEELTLEYNIFSDIINSYQKDTTSNYLQKITLENENKKSQEEKDFIAIALKNLESKDSDPDALLLYQDLFSIVQKTTTTIPIMSFIAYTLLKKNIIENEDYISILQKCILFENKLPAYFIFIITAIIAYKIKFFFLKNQKNYY